MPHAAPERRKEPRNRVHLWAVAQRVWDANRDNITVADLSVAGFKMRAAGRYAVGDVFFLELDGKLIAEVGVVRVDGLPGEYGCRFLHPLPAATVHRLLDIGGATSQSGVDQIFRAGTTARQ